MGLVRDVPIKPFVSMFLVFCSSVEALNHDCHDFQRPKAVFWDSCEAFWGAHLNAARPEEIECLGTEAWSFTHERLPTCKLPASTMQRFQERRLTKPVCRSSCHSDLGKVDSLSPDLAPLKEAAAVLISSILMLKRQYLCYKSVCDWGNSS